MSRDLVLANCSSKKECHAHTPKMAEKRGIPLDGIPRSLFGVFRWHHVIELAKIRKLIAAPFGAQELNRLRSIGILLSQARHEILESNAKQVQQ